MAVHIRDSGIWRQAKQMWIHDSGAWKQAKEVWIRNGGLWKQAFVAAFVVTVAASTSNLNLYNSAVAAGWDGVNAATIKLVVNPGVTISSSSVSTYCLDYGSIPSTCNVTITNNGNIKAPGGAGGTGGGTNGEATNGQGGGNAIRMTCPTTIDNTNGNIWGGGGGGGGGPWGSFASTGKGDPGETDAGGGGGGGAGTNPGAGGAAGTGGSTPTNGSTGTTTAGGDGGAGASHLNASSQLIPVSFGGRGGDPGQAGSPGNTYQNVAESYGTIGQGGPAGSAIVTNGFSVTWIGGNNGTQVRGAVA